MKPTYEETAAALHELLMAIGQYKDGDGDELKFANARRKAYAIYKKAKVAK